MRHLPRSIRSRAASRRSGSLMPALALALLAVLGGAALVIDRLALDTAKSELRASAEAAALAAARELANDDRLRPDSDPAALQMKARFAAARIANANHIAGEPLTLNTESNGDVRCGRLASDPESGEMIFLEAEGKENPTTVVVYARRTAERDSPIPLPLRTLYAPTDADVVAVAEASINFGVIGLRPVDELPIPTLPLAILSQLIVEQDSSIEQSPAADVSRSKPGQTKMPHRQSVSSWTRDIEQRRGTDRYKFDLSTGEVTQESDGIPEITLRTASRSAGATSNAFVLALTGDLTQDGLRRQICDGWSIDDLQPLGGEVLFGHGPLTLAGLRGVDCNALGGALRKVLGQSRVVLLYDREVGDARAHVASLQVSGMVAGRVMSVREISDCECEIVFQPAVLATRSAVTSSGDSDSSGEKNKYIANLRLTN